MSEMGGRIRQVDRSLGDIYSDDDLVELRRNLLQWYEINKRDLPWRRTKSPYAIWVSEIMLQQTRVAVVEGRFGAFLNKFPSVSALANADESEILAEWSGLGYYRRARMLHKAAQAVVAEFGGVMPTTAANLRGLPGVGAYTSAAVASIAYGEAVPVVDGNVERVIQRLAGWGSDSGEGPAKLSNNTQRMAEILLDSDEPGDFNQAMMELGATVCLPRGPKCLHCPLRRQCATQGEHAVTPRARMRSETAAYGLAIRARRGGREVLLNQRGPEHTVMNGMWELPALREVNMAETDVRMTVRHAIMQVNYYVRIRTVIEEDVEALTLPSENRRWVRLHDLSSLPLTGLARKVLLRARLPELALSPLVVS